MTKQVNLYAAKMHLSRLVDQAAAGEEIIIAKHGKPLARLVSMGARTKKREFGFWRGKVKAPTDEEWAEADAEILRDFEDSQLFPQEELTQEMIDARDQKAKGGNR
jgi:prevent-host-death family protein